MATTVTPAEGSECPDSKYGMNMLFFKRMKRLFGIMLPGVLVDAIHCVNFASGYDYFPRGDDLFCWTHSNFGLCFAPSESNALQLRAYIVLIPLLKVVFYDVI
ncbi:hypothetical protein GQR58_007075 [Nymphon striatum]|nr:hypothetical protein GQR58_007075 [Nymphon striatum]